MLSSIYPSPINPSQPTTANPAPQLPAPDKPQPQPGTPERCSPHHPGCRNGWGGGIESPLKGYCTRKSPAPPGPAGAGFPSSGRPAGRYLRFLGSGQINALKFVKKRLQKCRYWVLLSDFQGQNQPHRFPALPGFFRGAISDAESFIDDCSVVFRQKSPTVDAGES